MINKFELSSSLRSNKIAMKLKNIVKKRIVYDSRPRTVAIRKVRKTKMNGFILENDYAYLENYNNIPI